ncbi:uncharacterized protein PRCAT00002700001 [Priceomyces carsonii]|uniref:uncharacterized protein n=1 Tax=Priceomyces carsonii TaxID=28549 RepID=UPI002EDA55F8|nr:unnamed protein product [Priceomyces carsonii]
MEKLKVSSLEALLRFQNNRYDDAIVADASVLSCGCLVSESAFISSSSHTCPQGHQDVHLLREIKPLRELYQIVQQLNTQMSTTLGRRRRSSSKKSFTIGGEKPESQDLISLFYKLAKEESNVNNDSKKAIMDLSSIQPIDIGTRNEQDSPLEAISFSPEQYYMQNLDGEAQKEDYETTVEKRILKNLNEKKEYNFSKCFPFYRKYSSYPTLAFKSSFSSIAIPFKLNSVLKKSSRYIGSHIHTYTDFDTDTEITRFVLISEKRWELYQYQSSLDDSLNSNSRPVLLCCGKLTGEYGTTTNSMTGENPSDEIIIKNDFNQSLSNSTSNEDVKKKLQQWGFLYCKLSSNYLAIAGTKGILRVFYVGFSSKYSLGRPLYTYSTNFPIRCIAIAPNETLVACGVTAKERLSGKEQPFIILQKLCSNFEKKITSVERFTITMPNRDPIKLIDFNSSSTHLLSCTSWESRYSIIRLKDYSDNYRKPRLIWTDADYFKNTRRHKSENDSDDIDDTSDDDDQLMINEGVTDIHFGYSNTIVLASCSLKNKPPVIIKLYGAFLNSKRRRSSLSDALSIQNSTNSKEEEGFTNIQSSDILMKIPEVGSLIHKLCVSPRGDGIVFLSKDGSLYLVSTPNLQSNSTSSKRIVVLLGEVAGAEKFHESASIKFSSDGGKVFAVDRKGLFSVFDFTKGMPGVDSDIFKCKIITV